MSIEIQGFNPKIIVLACNWCIYSETVLVCLKHLEHPARVRIIKTPCLGHMDPQFIYQTFQNSADGVLLVSGCSGDNGCLLDNDCIYSPKDHQQIKEYLRHLGVEKERYQAVWLSDQGAYNFIEAFTLLIEEINKLGPYSKHYFPINSETTEVDTHDCRKPRP
jgi:F420-non-reducing hydrogenase iron-sulfur subunit